jgi:lipopolysaccharide transport system ATP-binding protein
MTVSIDAANLSLDYPLYTVRAKTLRSALLNITVGGRLMRTKQDVTVVRALSGVSFKLTDGDRLAIVGHNGSGKTSLLKVLAGVYAPSAGALDSIGLDHEASGLRNIRTLLMMQRLTRKEIERRLPAIIEFSGLGPFIHMPFKSYSAGMMARLTFAVGTEVEADILLMDEWMSAGDAAFRTQATERITNFVGSAKMVVIGTHDVSLVRSLCNKVLHLEYGRVKYFGSTEEWLRQGLGQPGSLTSQPEREMAPASVV